MADIDTPMGQTSGDRLPWNTPRIVKMTEARDMETGLNFGPEILVLVS